MATLSDYMSGTISLANGSVTVTGTGTLFEVTRFREGDTLQIQNLTAVISSVDSDTQLTLAEPWTGLDIVDGPYRARQLGDGTRVSTQAATVIQSLGNGVLTNLAELGVEEGKVPVGGPTGEYELTDLVQDPNGSLAKLAALTLAANKILNTNGSGNFTQSDITAAAIALLNLSGTAAADQLPYLTGASGAGLTTLTSFARTLLAATGGTAAVAALGITVSSSSGSTMSLVFPNGFKICMGTVTPTTLSSGGFYITMPVSFTNIPVACLVMPGALETANRIIYSNYRTNWSNTQVYVHAWYSSTNAAAASITTRVDYLIAGF
ncbi:hypothetical protein [Ochrobactrum sp. RH2CCR150]|uniref:hypothetical protein n=1 Tax=Ochrobactrum sp. RH2CCR150 TaxID=2587044 RepID=UPI0015FC9565|nr:hypothetical protein [Ochrobactrum sp. RH2CCR150]